MPPTSHTACSISLSCQVFLSFPRIPSMTQFLYCTLWRWGSHCASCNCQPHYFRSLLRYMANGLTKQPVSSRLAQFPQPNQPSVASAGGSAICGGAIFARNVTLTAVTIDSSNASYGGAVYAQSLVTSGGTLFTGCRAEFDGGCVNIQGAANLTDTNFTNCLCAQGGFGGGLYTEETLLARRVTFHRCVAQYGGGGYNAMLSSELYDVEFDSCEARQGLRFYRLIFFLLLVWVVGALRMFLVVSRS